MLCVDKNLQAEDQTEETSNIIQRDNRAERINTNPSASVRLSNAPFFNIFSSRVCY